MTPRPSTAEPCVDCATPVIGGGERCPACRWKHAASARASARAAVVWLAVSLNVVIVAVVLIFAGRNCQ